MLPSALTDQLQLGMADFLSASFSSNTAGFHGLIDDFVAAPGELFQGPFISLKLPFQASRGSRTFFPEVPLKYPPYTHQQRAFQQLSQRKNTIVATGTGSGKTECFQVPILAECARRVGERGIKAILIYPMNALASDQAERLAGLIHENEALRGKVTAGIYVGSKEKNPHTTMGERHIITDREAIRKNPPDILLTNYKMLDYMLIRPEDQQLWRDNASETLSYLVVDELHTFDGAQGTDLACLLRRLETRLHVPQDHLCYVGTSATLGDDDSARKLVDYASQIFGATFEPDCVVTEERQTIDQFLAGAFLRDVEPVASTDAADLNPNNFADQDAYLQRQVELWFPRLVRASAPRQEALLEGPGQADLDVFERFDPVELGEALKQHVFFHNLLKVLDRKVLTVNDVVEHFQRGMANFRDGESDYARLVVLSLLSLISAARCRQDGSSKLAPFMSVQLQLWQREMRRMVATVGPQARLRFFDDLTAEQRRRHLPVIHCRECSAMGWAALVYKDNPHSLETDLKTFYKGYFRRDPRVIFVYPAEGGPPGPRYWLDLNALRKQSQPPEDDGTPFMEVIVPPMVVSEGGTPKLTRDCPCCGASQSTALVGFQASTLTSTYIGQLFASRFNDDKKLLTFSDSVQDAAHRAGFFGARTWRFNLRIAIQNTLQAAGEPIALNELPDRVFEYWQSRLEPAAFVATFIAPNMEWLAEYEQLVETGELSEGNSLAQLIRQRISWEVHAEYALDARIGRSLARTGSSTVAVDAERLAMAVARATERLRNEIGPLREINADAVRRITLGMLHHMRLRGAVFQAELMADYLASGGKNTYSLTRRAHMPGYGPSSRLPSFLTNASGTRRFHTLHSTSKEGRTWYQTWFERSVESFAPLLGDLAIPALEAIRDELVEAEVLEVRVPGGQLVWGLRNDALWVTKDVAHLESTTTGERFFVPASELTDWDGMLSLVSGTNATYAVSAQAPSYYARLYQRGELHRIHAKEHTGLLSRDDRQEVETRFKSEQPQPWYPNLLSCTPTLEMGIDIGALSSAILCSVPPGQANFLQRIGRAGRRDGNALLLTIANAKPHDLYFFADPLEMISGDVDTPGVYLNASAVLQRQLTAFCFDNWVADSSETASTPRKLGGVFPQLDDPERVEKFPHNLLNYIENNQTLLLERFVKMFNTDPEHPVLSELSVVALQSFMQGDAEMEGSLAWKILTGLLRVRADRDNHKKSLNRVQAQLDKFDKLPVLDEAMKDELRETKREKAALVALVRQLNDRPTLSFFADEGLIPNYAFPEAGVSLKSIIWRRAQTVDDGDGQKYESWDYTFERPARSAIIEFAPRARFYAGGRYVQVNQVDVKGSTIEPWRFCDRCSFAQNVAGDDNLKSCPACGSTHWADTGQRRPMLKLRQVFANTNDRDSRITDDREERSPMFFNRQTLVTFTESGEGDAWYISEESVPFGFEYVKSCTFREINFGEFDDIGAKLSIAGNENVRKGFNLCTDCGMVQFSQTPEHARSCKFVNAAATAKYQECLYLYREFTSEAVRLLLPFIDEPGYVSEILEYRDKLEKIETLGKVDVGVIVDSVLERRLLEALRRMTFGKRDATFAKQMVRGKPGFRFEVDGQIWLIQPQVDLGAAQGVIVDTRPDFVFWPASESDTRRPIAVYVDGYAYHRDRVGKDLFQRMAVAAGDRFRTWSVSSQDVEAAFGKSKSQWFDIVGARDMEQRGALNMYSGADWRRDAAELDSFELFVQFLATPSEDLQAWGELALTTAFLPIASRSESSANELGAWKAAVSAAAPPNVADELTFGLTAQHLLASDARAPEGFVAKLFVAISSAGCQEQDPAKMRVLFELDDVDVQRERDDFHPLWNGTLRLFNLFQFLGTSLFVTTTSQDDFDFGRLLDQMVAPALNTQDDIAWHEAEEMTRDMDERYVDYLREYRAAGVAPPVGGYEPNDENGQPVGPPAEVAWPAVKVALFATEDVDPQAAKTLATVRAAGWTAFAIDHFVGRAHELKALLSNGS